MLKFMDSRFFRVYVIPGAVFQSVLVGGGYGTGREIVEFFTRFGAIGGLLGILVTWVAWVVVLGITYEFARIFNAYNYRDFFKKLLGRGWIAFEILFIIMFLLVLAVVASAAGEVFRESLGIPYAIGLAIMLSVVGILTFFGREVITKSLAVWTFFIYITFAIYFFVAFGQLREGIGAQLALGEVGAGWFVSGLQYGMYNLFIVPVILYATVEIKSRKESAGSALVAASICILPAILFHLTFLGAYPEVVAWEVPLLSVISGLAVAGLLGLYIVMLFGTLIETGAGLLQGINERIDGYLKETRGTTMPKVVRASVAVFAIALSAVLAMAGIIALIARGYGTIAWGFLAVYVIPICTIGVWKLWKAGQAGGGSAAGRGGAEREAAAG